MNFDFLAFIIVIMLLILIIYIIFINKKTNLNIFKKIKNNIEEMSNFSENIDLSKNDIEIELNKIENIIDSYDNNTTLSEKNRIIINELRNKLDVIRQELENPYVVAELKKEIDNKIIELEKMDKISYNNKKNIDKIDNTLIDTQKKLEKDYLKNKNSKITIDNDDYFKLCNNNKKCILMNVNEEGEYTIKSDVINFKNNNDNIIAKIDNDDIYFGGNDSKNSGLYIKNGETHINKLNTNELLLKDIKNNNMVDVGTYIEWLDNNKNYREYIDDVNHKNNIERINEIDLLKTKLKEIKEENINLDKKIDINNDKINTMKNKNKSIEDKNNNISNKYEIVKNELSEQFKRSTINNQHIKNYKDSIDLELVKLYKNIDKIHKKTEKIEEDSKLKLDIYERNRIKHEEELLAEKREREREKEREQEREREREEMQKKIDEEDALKFVMDNIKRKEEEEERKRKEEAEKAELARLAQLSNFFDNLY